MAQVGSGTARGKEAAAGKLYGLAKNSEIKWPSQTQAPSRYSWHCSAAGLKVGRDVAGWPGGRVAEGLSTTPRVIRLQLGTGEWDPLPPVATRALLRRYHLDLMQYHVHGHIVYIVHTSCPAPAPLGKIYVILYPSCHSGPLAYHMP